MTISRSMHVVENGIISFFYGWIYYGGRTNMVCIVLDRESEIGGKEDLNIIIR